jgi:two-component system, cell cycle response regulator
MGQDNPFGNDEGTNTNTLGGDKTTLITLDKIQKSQQGSSRIIPVLMVLEGVEKGKIYTLPSQTRIVIGRSRDCDITVPDASCSRKHAEIIVNPSTQEAVIQDLSSTNGTKVNGAAISNSKTIKSGDLLTLGDNSQLKFSLMTDQEAQNLGEIYNRATRDSLTNCYNRRFFEENLTREAEARNRSGLELGIIMLDVDHFKKVNDTYGHPTGDAVLRVIGKTIPTCIRSEDIFARLGGEEFAVLVRCEINTLKTMMERMRVVLERTPVRFEDKEVRFTVSVGGTLATGSNLYSGEQIVKRADEALYAAKQGGRNRCILKDPD